MNEQDRFERNITRGYIMIITVMILALAAAWLADITLYPSPLFH